MWQDINSQAFIRETTNWNYLIDLSICVSACTDYELLDFNIKCIACRVNACMQEAVLLWSKRLACITVPAKDPGGLAGCVSLGTWQGV